MLKIGSYVLFTIGDEECLGKVNHITKAGNYEVLFTATIAGTRHELPLFYESYKLTEISPKTHPEHFI